MTGKPLMVVGLGAVLAALVPRAAGAEGDSAWAEGPGGLDLGGDMLRVPVPGADEGRSGGAAFAAGEPRVIWLFWADGTPAPMDSFCKGATPPPFRCDRVSDPEECKRQIQVRLDRYYADFNVLFTWKKPDAGPHYTEVMSHDGAWCKAPAGAGGVAAFDCTDPAPGMAFAWLCGQLGPELCAVVAAQEHAHLVGLEHTSSRVDIMYPTDGGKTYVGFEDRMNTTSGTSCRSSQNSYRMMLERLGAWPSGTPKPSPAVTCTDAADPVVSILTPADGATVGGTFSVRAAASDDCGVKDVRIDVNGNTASADAPGPYEWIMSDFEGPLVITVTAVDQSGHRGSTTIKATAPGGAPAADGGQADGGDEADGGGAPGAQGGGGGCGCSFTPTRPGAAVAGGACLSLLLGASRQRRRRREPGLPPR